MKNDACSRLDAHRPVRRRYFLDCEGRQRSFPETANPVKMAEGVGVAVVQDETRMVQMLSGC